MRTFWKPSFLALHTSVDWLRAGWSGDRIPVGVRFSASLQTGPGAHPVSCTMGTGSFPGVKSGWGVTLTPHPLLVLWSRKSRTSTPPMSHMACTEPQCLYKGALYLFTFIPQLPACSFIAVTMYSCTVKNTSNNTLYSACYNFCLLLHISEKCSELHLAHLCLTDTHVKWNPPTNFWWALNTKFQRQAMNSFGDETCGGIRTNSPSGINSMHFV